MNNDWWYRHEMRTKIYRNIVEAQIYMDKIRNGLYKDSVQVQLYKQAVTATPNDNRLVEALLTRKIDDLKSQLTELYALRDDNDNLVKNNEFLELEVEKLSRTNSYLLSNGSTLHEESNLLQFLQGELNEALEKVKDYKWKVVPGLEHQVQELKAHVKRRETVVESDSQWLSAGWQEIRKRKREVQNTIDREVHLRSAKMQKEYEFRLDQRKEDFNVHLAQLEQKLLKAQEEILRKDIELTRVKEANLVERNNARSNLRELRDLTRRDNPELIQLLDTIRDFFGEFYTHTHQEEKQSLLDSVSNSDLVRLEEIVREDGMGSLMTTIGYVAQLARSDECFDIDEIFGEIFKHLNFEIDVMVVTTTSS